MVTARRDTAGPAHHARQALPHDPGRTALRVRLDIRHTRLKNMSWELMTLTLGGDFALVLSPSRPITRCIYDLSPATDMEPPQPLRMLIVVSQPENVHPFDAEKILCTLREVDEHVSLLHRAPGRRRSGGGRTGRPG